MENTRRNFLLSTAAVSTAILAGCSEDDDIDENGERDTRGNPDPPDEGDRHESDIPESDEYQVWKARGQTVHLQHGETYENVIWDLSTGDDVTINTIGVEDWEIRNVGFYGQYRGGSRALMTLGTMEGETGRVENVYFGDGGSGEGMEPIPTAPSAVMVEGNLGEINFVNCNIQGFPDYGVLDRGSDGVCRWETCYVGNNGGASIRSGQGGEIRDCVLFNDDTEYGSADPVSHSGTLVSASGGVEVYESHLSSGEAMALSGDAESEGNIMYSGEVDGSRYGPFRIADAVGGNPSIERPDSVPGSAVEAALMGFEGADGS